VDFKVKLMDFGDKKINLTIWDTGRTEIEALTLNIFGLILAFSWPREVSFPYKLLLPRNAGYNTGYEYD